MARPNTAAVRLLAGSREPVLVATTANITLSGLQTIDDVAVTAGKRVLVKDQADGTENGIYEASSGIWYRAGDARTSRAINKGITVYVQSGTENGGKLFAFRTLDPDIGEDDISITLELRLNTSVALAIWRVEELLAYNVPASSTQMKMSAAGVVMYNPNSGTSLLYGPEDTTSNLTCDISTTGAGGRDGAAFTAFENVWFYFIGGAALPMSTLVSRTGPRDTNANAELGPILPGAYTVYTPAFPAVISYNADLIYNSHRGDEGSRITKSASTSGNQVAFDPGGVDVIGYSIISGADIPEETYIISQTSGVPLGLGAYTLSRSVGTISTRNMDFAPPYPSQLIVQDRIVNFSTPRLNVHTERMVIPAAVPTSENPFAVHEWDYRLYVPAAAKRFDMFINAEVSSDAGELFTGALEVGWYHPLLPNSGGDINNSTYAHFGPGKPMPDNFDCEFPVVSLDLATKLLNGDAATAAGRCGRLYFSWLIGGGAYEPGPPIELNCTSLLRSYTF